MAEYINKEELIEACNYIVCYEDDEETFGISEARIDFMPTIDIVCCSECRWWKRKEDTKYGFCHNCQHGYLSDRWDISIDRKTKENHYCADAIRKD